MYEIIVEINGVKRNYTFNKEGEYLSFLDGIICGLDLCGVKHTFKETIDVVYFKRYVVLKSV